MASQEDMPCEKGFPNTYSVKNANKGKSDASCFALIGLVFTNFLLKIGLILQTIYTLILQYKMIAALTLALSLSAAANVVLVVEYQEIFNELEVCNSALQNHTSTTPLDYETTLDPNDPSFSSTSTEPTTTTTTSVDPEPEEPIEPEEP